MFLPPSLPTLNSNPSPGPYLLYLPNAGSYFLIFKCMLSFLVLRSVGLSLPCLAQVRGLVSVFFSIASYATLIATRYAEFILSGPFYTSCVQVSSTPSSQHGHKPLLLLALPLCTLLSFHTEQCAVFCKEYSLSCLCKSLSTPSRLSTPSCLSTPSRLSTPSLFMTPPTG